MRYVISLIALLFALGVSNPLTAQGRGHGQANKPSAGSTRSPKADHPKPKADRPAPNAGATKNGPTSKPTDHVAKADTRPKGNKHKTPDTTTGTPPTTSVTPTTPVTGKVKNPRLESRLLALLPPGTNVQDASQGFKTWGQFVAAVHVSNNLGLPFDSLKTAMTGATPMSLGQAIQSLKGETKTLDGATLTQTKIKNEVKKAEDAASTDLRLSSESN